MIRRALQNPHLIVVLALMVLVIGVISYLKIPADLLPIFKTPAVQIVTFYPGMPPEVMERDIMSRMQRWTGQSMGIEHQEAKAMLGVCVVKDFFREDISLDTAMSQIASAVGALRDRGPERHHRRFGEQTGYRHPVEQRGKIVRKAADQTKRGVFLPSGRGERTGSRSSRAQRTTSAFSVAGLGPRCSGPGA